MKSVDTGYRPPERLNPHRAGPYIVHAAVYPTKDGRYGVVVFADKIEGDGALPRPALNLHRVSQTFGNYEEAELFGVQFGTTQLNLDKGLS